MAIPSRQIGQSQEANLLWNISKQIEKLIYQVGNLASPVLPKLYGAFYDTTTQIATINTAVPMNFNTVDLSNGVNVELDGLGNPSIVSVERSGVYDFQFSSQFHRLSGGGANRVTIWFRKNGVDIPWSSSFVTVNTSGNYIIAAWNYVIALTPTDSIQLIWLQDDNIAMQAIPAGVHPAVPSVILTVSQVN